MLKRILCLVIISSLLYTDIVYPLNNSSPFLDEDFRETLSTVSEKEMTRDASGVWVVGKNWKMRFFEQGKAQSPRLDTDDELVYEEDINGRLKVQVYFKGLGEDAKGTIRGFLFNNPNISRLASMVLAEISGGTRIEGGRAVRREVSREENEKLSGFIGKLMPQPSFSAITDAVVMEMGVEVDEKTKGILWDYLSVFTKRMRLKEQRDKVLRDKDIFILKKLSELEGEKIYKSVRRLFERLIGKEKRLKIVPPNIIARILGRYEGISGGGLDPSSIISFTWGDTIYFNSDSRLSDFIVYILHEVVHLYEGDEKDAHKMNKELIGVLKGVVSLLRAGKGEHVNSIADVLEYEILGYELDLHTARLQITDQGETNEQGEAFLSHFELASVNIVPADKSYIEGMKRHVTGVIREKKDSELFAEIRTIIEKQKEPRKLGIRLFWAFMKYVKRRMKEKIEEEEELLEEEEVEVLAMGPLTEESVLSYMITREEAERRLRDVVLNPDMPLFARINDAIMIDIFSATKKIELGAVEKIEPILEKEPVKALQILEELRNERSVELISGFLRHKDPRIRGIAAERLFNIARSLVPSAVFGSPKTIENMLDFVNRAGAVIKDGKAFRQVVTVLSSIRCREAIPVFMDIIEKNKSGSIRVFVAGALGSIGDTSVIPMIRDIADVNSVVACLVQVPNDEGAQIVIDIFLKAKDKKLRARCLEALEAMIRRRRISTSVMVPVLERLDKKSAGFILGRVASIALQEGKADVATKCARLSLAHEDFFMGLIHDTFMDIDDIQGGLEEVLGKWAELIRYVQKIRDDIYSGKREYTDIVWKEIAEELARVKPEEDKPIGKMWFQRMCLAISYRVLLDTWDVGRIEDRDFILELMILRTSFVPKDELPEGAIGATEAIHGEYVDLHDSLFSTPVDIPIGVNTAWHEATHLLSGMGIADISDVSLLGASSHENIEFYLLSEIFGLPPIKDVVSELKNGRTMEDLEEVYVGKGLPREKFMAMRPVLEGMAVADKAEGPLSAFFLVRDIDPKKARKWGWEDVLWKLQKINTEIVNAFTIRGKQQRLADTYLHGARFSGYAHRLGVETGFHDATNIYVELLVKSRLRPAQAEFVARVIARFMTEEKDFIERMKKGLRDRYKNVPAGEIEKWLKRFIVERIKVLSIGMAKDIDMWITYGDLAGLVDKKYGEIRREMLKADIQKDIADRVIKAISTRKRIFKAVRPGYKRDTGTKIIFYPKDSEGFDRPGGIYRLENSRYLEITVDFGEGEEPYAYVDVEKGEIRLVDPADKRIYPGQIAKAVEQELKLVDKMQIDSPLEEKALFSLRSLIKKIRGMDWWGLRRYGYYGILLVSVVIISSISGNFEWGFLGLIAMACAVVALEIVKIQRLLYEDVKVRLSKELRRKLKENKAVNKRIRRFREDLKLYKLITPRGDIFSIENFNRVLLTYDRDGAIGVLTKDLRIWPKAARRIIDWALKVLEYREEITMDDLDDMVLQPYMEKAIVRIINGGYVYPAIGKISPLADVRDIGRFKRVGLAECFEYAKEGRDKLAKVLRNSFMVGVIRRLRLSSFVAEPVADIVYDIYLSSKDDKEFVDRIVQLDVTDYITPPSVRRGFIREFEIVGDSYITADERIFDAVLDSMGISEGLKFLEKVKEETEDRDLYWTLLAYVGSFEIGPGGYVPVVIEDAWRSFNLWRKRVGDVPYEDVQRRFIELYMRHIRKAKGDIPRWGWTMLWLAYFEEGSRMYNAVSDLLKGKDIDEICDNYRLTPDERQRLLYTAPIDGFISLVQIYCKDIVWGRDTLMELEERLKKDMHVVTSEDVAGEELFNKEAQSWLYTFRNIPSGLQDRLRDKLKKEVIDLIMDVLIASGSRGCTREELEKLFDLIYATRLPTSGQRFVDDVSVIDLCKILFDYARYRARNDAAIRKVHSARNTEIVSGKSPLGKETRLFFRGERLVIFTQRHAETIGLLRWIKGILEQYPDLREIRIIPQKSMWEPNSTKEDIETLVKEMGLDSSRVVVLENCSPGLSWLKGPECSWVKEEIGSADAILGVGWDNFVSMQGLNRPCYFAFSIDDPIKAELTGCDPNGRIFVKTCGGLLASKIGEYRLVDYLTAINSPAYKKLLRLFKWDEVRLHRWIVREAKRTKRKETDVVMAGISFEGLKECLLRDPDSEARMEALEILINNYKEFEIKKATKEIDLDGVKVETDGEVDCYYFPGRQAAILERNGKRLILEVFDKKFLRIGEKVYSVAGVVNLHDIATEPAFWIGNSEYVEFIGDDIMKEGEAPRVHMRDIPQEILANIPQTKPVSVYGTAERALAEPVLCLPLRLHYAVVLLSSFELSQSVKGLEELERLRAMSDPEILEIMRARGLSRVCDWLNTEVPSFDRDIFSLTNFSPGEEKILQVLGGAYLLRPPLVAMPGQGVSTRFFDSVRGEVSRFGIDLVRGNYAEGTGSVLFQDGRRHYVKEGEQLVELGRQLSQGQMVGAIRLKKDGGVLLQVPANAGILNYLKVIHHLSHIFAERFREAHTGRAGPFQEFTPAIEDILVIKYMERLAGAARDGFSDFKDEIRNAGDEEELRMVFKGYGLAYTANVGEILELGDMSQFADYITRNNLGNFYSVKEFLNILINYSRNAVRDYIRQLPHTEGSILERLLSVGTDTEINSLLAVASLLASSHIPKVHLDRDIEGITNLLERPKAVLGSDVDTILGRINGILESAEPFSAKAVKIVGSVLYRSGVKVGVPERRDIEEEVMDLLSGKWFQRLGELLRDRVRKLETRGGVDIKDFRERLEEIERYMLGETQRLARPEQAEVRGEDIDETPSWNRIEDYVREHKIEEAFFDIDKTILDAPGFITTTPWFKELEKKEGLKDTIALWRKWEEEVMERGMLHPMEDEIPDIIRRLKDMGVTVKLYTARAKEDVPRTIKMLRGIGIEVEESDIITSKRGTPEAKKEALVEYYIANGLFEREIPTLYMDDTLANLKAVHGDTRFSHIRCVWYHPPFRKRYEVDPEEFLEAGDKALEAGNVMEALEWYYNAFYVKSRKDIASQVYDIVTGHIGFEATIEGSLYGFIRNRFNRYQGAVERERAWQEPPAEGVTEAVKPRWIEGAPDIPVAGFWKGVKRIVVIGSHPHGDHVKGFLDYAKRRLKPLVDTKVPEPYEIRTGGPITHSLSNYWARIGEETVVLFDLGWFPEGFVDPLIQTIHPRDREIVFMMDPDTARTMDFERQLKRLKLDRVRFEPVSYGEPVNIPIEPGRILQVENHPAYHLPKEVGSSVYLLRTLDAKTQEEIQSVGYINEIGDMFPEEIDDEFVGKLSRLDRHIVDGTNLFAPKGEEPLPVKGRPSKVPRDVKLLNRGRFLISHFNTTSPKMLEEAEEAAKDLDPGIPIVVIGGKDAIDLLKRSYGVPRDMDYYTFNGKKIYLVHDVVEFHRKLRESGELPKLEDVLEKRIGGLKKAGWTKKEIDEFVAEWKRRDGEEIEKLEGPDGRAREVDALLWDLRKTKAVVISSSQFRGDPTKDRFKNFKGFQILDAIVDKKDVSILIEGRLHAEGEEGTVLKVLLSKRKDRYIDSITGRKKVRAFIDNQWRSGHITFRQLMFLLNCIADRSVKTGNVYNRRTYIPVPPEEWLRLVPDTEVQKYGKSSSRDVIDIINRWNDRKDVTIEEIHFVKEVLKEIFKTDGFWKEFRADLLKRLDEAEKDARLMGKANNRIFVASTSKFVDVLHMTRVVTEEGVTWRRQLDIDPGKLRELLEVFNRFVSSEVGVSYAQGKTIDLVQRRVEEHSEDLEKGLKRGYLKELYRKTVEGKIPPDLSLYTEKKGIEVYRVELERLLEDIKRKIQRRSEEDPFNIWFGELKGYIESQFLRLGFRYTYKIAPPDELRKELSIFYDAIIEFVYNYIQEDMGKKYIDIAVVSGGDYAIMKALFKDTVSLGILAGTGVEQGYVNRLRNRLFGKPDEPGGGILNSLGIPVEFSDWPDFLNRRIIAGPKGIEKELRLEVGKGVLVKRKTRFEDDNEILKRKRRFDIHTGPGGLDDIELIRLFFGKDLDTNDKTELDRAEEFLRRYKEEVGLSTGGEREKATPLLAEITGNLGLAGTAEFNREFYERASKVFNILKKVLTKGKAKNLSFGEIDEQKDIHEGVFEKADRDGRLFTEDNPGKAEEYFRLIRKIIKGHPELEARRYKIIEEEPGKPTMFYREEPFGSVLSHGGRSRNTIYLGLNTLKLVKQRPEYRNALLQLLLHDNRDMERGYHLDDLKDADEIYRMWNDLITDGRFSIMHELYLKRSRYFLRRKVPVDIRLIKGENLYEFRHGDAEDLPDFVGLNLGLFKGGFSPETQVFLLRHCTDRVWNPRYEAIINDIKYLLAVDPKEKAKILSELYRINASGISRYFEWGDHKGQGNLFAYIEFLEQILRECKPGIALSEAIKEKIREYTGLRFDTYTSPDRAFVWYSVGGNPNAKRTLVFLHGIGVNSRDWRTQVTFLEKDCRIVAIDLRGFGKSKGIGTRAPHIKNYAEDIEGILTKERITDAILVGHSMGGIVALNLDELYGDTPLEKRRIKGLVLIASTAGDPTESFIFKGIKNIGFKQLVRGLLFCLKKLDAIWDNPYFKKLAKGPLLFPFLRKIFMTLILEEGVDPIFIRKVIRSIFRNELKALIYGFESILTHDVEDRIDRLGVPVLWIVGRKDMIILSEEQERDAKKIKKRRIVPVPSAKHYPHARFPRYVNNEIYKFVNEGEFRFLQLINERFQLDVSMDELEKAERRLRERLRDVDESKLRLIRDVSKVVEDYGRLTGVSRDIMKKAAMTVAGEIITTRGDITLPSARPVSHEEGWLYRYIVESV